MIKQMQRRFILISMGSFTAVLLALLIGLNGLYFWQTIHDMDYGAARIVQQPSNDAPSEPNSRPRATGFSFDSLWQDKGRNLAIYFLIETDANSTIQSIQLEHSFNLSQADAESIAAPALKANRTQGWTSQYRYQQISTDTGKRWIFTDASRQLASISRLAITSGIIAIVSLTIIYILLTYFSRRAVQPLIQNIERQREFITNASHEIKTPLAVLSTNNDILEMTGHTNEWTQSNKRQIQRLNDLVEQMLLLARFDEGQQAMQFETLSLRTLVQDQLDALAPLIHDTNRTVKLEIPHEILVNVDRQSFQGLLQALLENALKYHTDDCPIILQWLSSQKQLSIANHCEPMTETERQQLFDRFYRRDTARHRDQGGSGIGLSLAQALAHANRLTLTAELITPTEIQFNLTFH